ncbi:ROK family protein [Microbacterium sp. cx-59]|uniref:ROK family protein n=1 Tax=Microbacterium sp. cx-59 TaxID=2891207 RepID=UPI001E308293|nr:ROK family protein [Microbacterium sp. cx-59]MCC4909212.1 ROK family protein [Microbacterium sp. cx-59]
MPAIDQSGMRRLNTAATLRVITDATGTLTSADLVAQTRLSRRTIELIVGDLIAQGWVDEADSPAPTTAGRPKKYYRLVADRATVLSVGINPPLVRAVVADLRGREIARAEGPSGTVADTLDSALRLASQALAQANVDPDHLHALVVGLGGTFSPDGVVLTSPVDPEWVGVDVREPFARRFDVPVVVENDTNLSALAARAEGPARGEQTFALLMPGIRVSAGVVINGELHRGFQGAAGELVRLPELRDANHRGLLAQISSPDERERVDARAHLRRAIDGDPAVREDARAFFDAVARVVAVLGWVIAPPVIVLVGGFEGLEDGTLGLLRDALSTMDAPDIDIRVAALTPDFPVRGGIQLALDIAGATIFDPRR